ncbi:MAG: adenine phosphoribosyltransferase [Planctomycetota bacterium]
MNLTDLIADVPDYPKPGITFKDITPLLSNPAGLAMAVELMASPFRGKGIEMVCGAESRGFIFGTAVAQALSAGFVPIRKPGKLPRETTARSYELEYGSDTLEVHTDAVKPGQKVLMCDDLLATGGTLRACCELIDGLGAEIVGVSLAIELEFLNGREKVRPFDENLHAVVKY